MAELDLLRSLPIDITNPSDEARARARGRLSRHMRRAPSLHRRRLLVPAIVLAAAGALAAFADIGNHGNGSASAAPLLRTMATVARTQEAQKPLTAGHFRYTRSVIAYMSGGNGWNALSPGVREIWLRPNGSGYLYERWHKPKFLSAADQEGWIAAGRPQVNPAEDSGRLPPAPQRRLPTDPDALYARLHDDAVGHGSGTESEMFTLVADSLRESDASPPLRASLFEVAARIPGVELLGPATDRIGRHGVAVAYSDGKAHERHELIFDRRTAALLGEEYVQLDGNSYGYPAGTVTGYATYVVSGVVGRIGVRP